MREKQHVLNIQHVSPGVKDFDLDLSRVRSG
jgi:hypothetical protein